MTITANLSSRRRRLSDLAAAGPIYLNNAAEGWPKAPGVAAAVGRALEGMPVEAGRGGAIGADPIAACRQRVADLLGIPDARRVVLTCGGTHALNLAIHGVGLRSNAIVVTTVMEHNSVLRPLFHLQQSGRARVIMVGLDPGGGLDDAAFGQALRERPALVAITHASNVTGRINDVARWFEMAKESGAVTLLDAAQTAGQFAVQPLLCNADLVAFPGHKGLHGPAGTGALYVAPALDLEQILVGGTGRHSESRRHPPAMPERLEAGTPNGPGLAGLAAALAWHAGHGSTFRQGSRQAGEDLRDRLHAIPGVQSFHTAADGAAHVGVVSLQIAGWRVDELGQVLRDSFGIVCRTGLHCAPLMHAAIGSAAEGTVRLSTSGFNTDAEIAAAVDAVGRLACA